MYKTILLVLDGVSTDRALVEQVKPLAKLGQIRVVLFHVQRWMAPSRNEYPFYPEANSDIEYFKKIRCEFQSAEIPVNFELAYGDPATGIVRRVQRGDCDLVVMKAQTRHSMTEVFFGNTASRILDSINTSILLIKTEHPMAKLATCNL